MPDVSDSDAQKAMGRRLRQVREALELSQREMAQVLGISTTGLSAWEGGRNQIDLIKLARAATRYRFTTDWIAIGDMSGIRRDLAEKLERVAARSLGAVKRGRPTNRDGPGLSLAAQ